MSSPDTGRHAAGDQRTERMPQQPAPEQRTGQQQSEQPTAEQRAPEQGREWAVSRAPVTAAESGWLAFGGWMLILVGAFNIIAGFTSLLRPEYFVVGGGELLVLNFGAWGWIWLAFGVVQVVAGAGCLSGQRWARIAGIAIAGLSAIGHLTFLAAFPIWELVSIVLAILVMYALVVPDKRATA
ncbi:hypothetical protein EIL87_16640 [Saccharopolyspora rhizosphaerae]|uniref:DUF7144 domain-containing protein n=1 Tax=Saccharopolyspora rhizosphaerae TaxID=2492662 RepID=A0A426JR67_9PSEU|nr:hypothetical protein [Saccharopolyspora rhizosphaerae]RRO15642.1 hypothetical protein EIL87_16640 [Saccharopolyspora rhizosphaerae]